MRDRGYEAGASDYLHHPIPLGYPTMIKFTCDAYVSENQVTKVFNIFQMERGRESEKVRACLDSRKWEKNGKREVGVGNVKV